MKQLFNYMVAFLGLLLCAPLFLYIAIRIRRDNSGRVFYRQERLGKNGVPFEMIKFRTMVEGAEKEIPMLAVVDDSRVTSYGRVLRRYHLDELPQLWNVLRGEMSIVGPRPERIYFVEKILEKEPSYEKVFLVKPGMTSLGIIKYGYASTVEEIIERSQYDLYYVEHYNLMLDLKILVATVREVFSGRGL